MTPTNEVRAKLDELGIAWVAISERATEYTQEGILYRAYETFGGLQVAILTPVAPEQAIAATVEPNKTKEWRSVALGLFDSLEKADLEVAKRWLCDNDLLGQEIAYGDAKAATVGDKPKDNPRNYNPDGTPKIPNMNVGADPDWVDWVASLEHKEPLDLKEVVEQFMFEVICFGGEMGPNDCGGEYCPDEGMVYTNDFIDGWVRRIDATVGAGTCIYVPDETGFTWRDENDVEHYEEYSAGDECGSASCDKCGYTMMVGDDGWFDGWDEIIEWTEEDGSEHKGYVLKPRFKHCPNCGRRIKEEAE